jgi:hypothetical protein
MVYAAAVKPESKEKASYRKKIATVTREAFKSHCMAFLEGRKQ